MYPNLFSIGPLVFHSYGLFVAIGVLLASRLLIHYARRVERSGDQMIDLVLVVTLAGFLCARILYVIYEFEYFRTRPLEVFAIWNGGIIFYGGQIGATIALFVYTRVNKLQFFKILDLFVVAVCVAQIFGRIGCFLNGCCYGKETTCFLGVHFPFASTPLHPTQLYEAFYALVLFIFLKLYYDKNYQAIGSTSLVYFTLQPVGRFALEYFRNDMPELALGFTLGQWMSVGVFLAAVVTALIWKERHGHR